MKVSYAATVSHVIKLMGASQTWSEKRVGGHDTTSRKRMYVFNK